MGGASKISRLVVAVVLAAGAAVASVAVAQNPKPVEVKLACAQKGSGKLHFVGKASDCPTSRGKLVRFPQDFPVIACVANKAPRELFRVSNRNQCKAPKHPDTSARRLPGSNNIKLCIDTGDGTLRVVARYSACTTGERRGVLRKLPNRKPVVDTSPGATPYTEGARAKAVDPALKVSDANDTHFERASVRIGGFRLGDALVFAKQLGITGTYDSGTGVLTLKGHATKTAYRDALRSVRFRTPADPPGTSRSIVFRVNDGQVASDPATKRITVTASNDAPTITMTPGFFYWSEGDGPQEIDPGLTLTDPDSKNIVSAVVDIGPGFVPADEELTFTDQLGITGSYDDSTGTLTLTGLASTASYQTALRSVNYRNANQKPSGARPISFRATDANQPGAQSKVATRRAKLFNTNDGPTMTTSDGVTSFDVSAGAPVVIDPELALADIDDTQLVSAVVRISTGFQPGDVLAFTDQLGITGAYQSSTGTLFLEGTASMSDYQTALRSVTFDTPNGVASDSRVVGFKAYDGDNGSSEVFKTISFVP